MGRLREDILCLNSGFWDLTTIDTIPDGARIETVEIKEKWSFFKTKKERVAVGLFNGLHSGVFLDEGILSYHFWGEPVKQVWSAWSWFSLRGTAKQTQQLVITWYDSNTEMYGTIDMLTINEEKGTKEVGANHTNGKKGEYKMKVNVHASHTSVRKQASTYKKFEEHLQEKLEKKDEFIRSDHSIILEGEPLDLVNIQKNSISIQIGLVYSLGIINRKPFQARLLPNGGLETNFNPRFKGPPIEGGNIKEEQRVALETFLSLSSEEKQEAARRTAIFVLLFEVAKGSKGINEIVKAQEKLPVKEILNDIGLNTNVPFFINGNKYVFPN